MAGQGRRWIRPCGMKLTDVVAICALGLSVIGLLSPTVLMYIPPDVETMYPERITFTCLDRVEEKASAEKNKKKITCEKDSVMYVTADLFSLLNNSDYSTQPEILNKILMTITSVEAGESRFLWKYFSEVLGNANSRETNAGRVIFRLGDLRNIEIQFYQDMADSSEYTWSSLENAIAKKALLIKFHVDFETGNDQDAVCKLSFHEADTKALEEKKYEYHYVVASATCEEVE